MANNSPTIVAASLSDDQLKKSIDSLVTHVDEAMKKMVQSTNNAVGEMEAKLKSLGNLKIESGGSADGGSSRRTSSVEKETKARKELNMTLDQQANAINTVVQSEKKYTDEVLRQAAAIRSSKEWKEKGHVIVGDVNYYDKERANVSKRDKQLLLSLEEQIVQVQQKEAQEALVVAEAKRQQAQAAKEAAQASKGVSAYDLGIDPNVSVGKQKQIASIKTASKETEYLRQQVASLLEVEEREVKSVNITTASYSELSQHLKQLQSAYNKLGADRIKKGEGVDIANEIQRTQRAMQKLQQTMSRPVSLKDALGGSEKTLDDLAYKMHRLQSYRGGLNFKTQSDEVARVNQKYAELQKKMDVIMERNQRMIASNNALGRSWNYMKNRLAFYVTVGASTSFIKNLIDVRSQYEMNEKALGVLLDSASRGTRIFNELSQMALVSPYTLIELSNAAKQLTAYDIAAKDVVDTTRRLADMASAVGVPVERLTYALGQIKAYGYLNSRDARMFANAGIPLVKQLADRYSELEGKMVSTADVYDRMKKKAIDYNDVMAVINKMTDEGGKFFDFQAKMAETLKVRLANLTLAWNNMLNDMGKDNQGVMTTGIKGLTVMFKHWRELYRIISTVIVAIGAYKAASMLAGIAASRAVSSTIPAWFRLANIVRTAQGNMALLGLTMRSIPFTAWVTAIATLASYFILFNNSSDDVKQKLEGIKSAFDGVRKEVETMFADAIKTDNIGTQLTKLRDMLELAETELGVTIPIKLEDVNEGNVRQKLKEAKQFIDEYVNFSQTFSEAAAGTKFNELMNDFGSKARSTYTNVTESINSVIVALQELSDKGQASKRDIEILNELTSGQKDDESRIEYLQRLVSLYEELGLIGQKKVTPRISFFGSSEDNIEELEQQQENALNRLGIKNKSVFENMLKDVQGYYSSSSIAAYQFEQQVMRVAEKIDINNIPVEQRTMKLTAAINEEASQNNWNQFEKEFARQIANEKFGTTIEISDESKKAAEEDLQAWQRNIKEWAKNNGITFDVSFQTNDTEASYAKRMLQEAKDAKEIWETLGRKEKQGTGSKDSTTKAYNEYLEKRKLAAAAGADLSSLDAKSRKAASKAESELAKALKDELSTIEKVRSIYKDLTKEGMSHANAVERATKGWEETVNAINKVLQKNGLKKLNLSDFVGIENPREILKTLQSQLDSLVKRGASTSEIKVLQEKIQTLSVDADKYDLTKITKGLNSELDRLKEEYELAVSLDADPELGSMFADWMGIDMDNLPRTAQEYANQATNALNKALKERDADLELPNLLNITDDDLRELQNRVGTGNITQTYVDEITKAVKDVRGVFKKEKEDTSKEWNALVEKYGGLQAKILQIYKKNVQQQASIVKQFGNNEQISKALDLVRKIQISQDPADIARLQEELAKIINDITKNKPIALKTYQATQKEQKSNEGKAYWEDFKDSDLYAMTFEDVASLSNRAIDMMIEKLEELKDKVKESPESMKALIKAKNDLEEAKNIRDPFGGMIRGLKMSVEASKEAKTARDQLAQADIRLENAEKQLENAKASKDITAIAKAEQEVAKAKEKRETAQKNLTKAENKGKKGQKTFIQSAQALSQNMQTMGDIANQTAEIFRMFGENDTADAIAEIGSAFTSLIPTIVAVAVAIKMLESTSVILLAISAAISAVIGLVSFFSGNANKKITEKVEESERAVKRLENSYKKLEYAAEQAFGAATSGAQQALKANKELQLFELRRQLALEQSRSGKNYDEDKVLDLKGQIIDLENEIKDFTKGAVNDLLGISSHGDFFEDMISEMIDAFKSGEDAMKVFEEKWSKMIDNMIMKTIVSQVLQNWVNSLEKGADNILDKYTKSQSDKIAELNNNIADVSLMGISEATHWMYDNDRNVYLKMLRELESDKSIKDQFTLGKRIKETYLAYMQNKLDDLNAQLDKASLDATGELIDYYSQAGEEFKTNYLGVILDKIKENWNFGQDSENKLSQLQQGIQSVSETTAGALEAYMNGVSQQVYLHSELLTQIRDAIAGTDSDIQLGVQGQILLQLQTSYQTQQAIQSILEGWSSPNGMSVRVEMV